MSIVLRILAALVAVFIAWLLTMKGIPFLFVGGGRLLGFRMKLTPLTAKRVARFRSIRRGYLCFVGFATAFVLSLFLELLVNGRPLYIRYQDHIQFPAVAEWLDDALPFLHIEKSTRASDYGLEGSAEVPYHEYDRWVHDPKTLLEDAHKARQWIVTDEAAFRKASEERAKESGAKYDPHAPLPAFKQEEYKEKRARAKLLEALHARVVKGEVGILPTIYPWSPEKQYLSLGTPPLSPFQAGKPLLGTDTRGRGILAQLLYGFRVSFAFAILVSFVGFAIGVTIGAIMGYFGGWIDIGVQRFIEVWASIPFFYVLMIVGSIYTPSFVLLVVLLVVLAAWTGITWTMRGEFYREKARDYVQAARAIGVPTKTILFRHILPNGLVPIVTFLPFAIVGFVNTLVALDFLGFGLPPGTPSWGDLIRQGSDAISQHPFILVPPIVALAVTLFAVVTIGEAVREAFDPKVYARLR